MTIESENPKKVKNSQPQLKIYWFLYKKAYDRTHARIRINGNTGVSGEKKTPIPPPPKKKKI